MKNVMHINMGPAFWRGEVDLVNDDIKIALLNAHIPRTQNQFFSQVLNDEIQGPGYDVGGQSLMKKDVILSGNITVFRANDVIWSASSLKASHAVVYKDTGNSATSILLVTKDFGGIKTSENAPFKVRFSENGVMRATL